jgi:predicted kinase
MSERTLTILRAVSGAGKTTLARVLEDSLPDCRALAADDYHYDDEGNYNFNIANLGKAHQWCQMEVLFSMRECTLNIVVHNTNTSERELKPYLDLAEEWGYKVVSLIVENRHRGINVHNVPSEVLTKQEKRLRNSIKF